MFEGGLARCTALRGGLHLQTLKEDWFTAIRTVAVSGGVETLQSRLHLSHLVEVPLFLLPVEIRNRLLRCLVLSVRYLMHRRARQFAPSLLGGVHIRSQFK